MVVGLEVYELRETVREKTPAKGTPWGRAISSGPGSYSPGVAGVEDHVPILPPGATPVFGDSSLYALNNQRTFIWVLVRLASQK